MDQQELRSLTKGDVIESHRGSRRVVLAVYGRECLIAGEGTDGAIRVYTSTLYGFRLVGRCDVDRERVTAECSVWSAAEVA